MEKVVIDRTQMTVEIYMNKNIYDEESVRKSMYAFSENFNLKKDGDMIVFIDVPDEYIDIVGFEFYNYVLELKKN